MCVGPLRSRAWLDQGEAQRPPLRRSVSAVHSWQHHMAESPTSVGLWPAPAYPGGDAGKRRGALPRCSAPAGQRHTAAAATGVVLPPVIANGVALPLLLYTPMRWDVILPGSQRPRSQLRPCLILPLHPQGDSTRVGPLALRSCVCYAACQNRLARTAVANPGRSVRRRRTAGFPAAGRIPPIRRIVFVRTALALGHPGPVA
jgi:hypothetical protein